MDYRGAAIRPDQYTPQGSHEVVRIIAISLIVAGANVVGALLIPAGGSKT